MLRGLVWCNRQVNEGREKRAESQLNKHCSRTKCAMLNVRYVGLEVAANGIQLNALGEPDATRRDATRPDPPWPDPFCMADDSIVSLLFI